MTSMDINKIQAFGIIPLKDDKVLLVKHQKGHWAFPKGRAEEGETALAAAKRELTEETGLVVLCLLGEKFTENYLCDGKEKTVTYFLAEVTGDLKLQEAEIADARWLNFDEAEAIATFPECKKLVRKLSSSSL